MDASGRAREIERRNLYIVGVLVLASLAFVSVQITLSVLVGGIVTIANFRILWKGVEGLLHRQEISKGLLYLGISIKFLLLIGVIGFVVIKLPIHVGAFLVGLSSIVIAVVSEGFYARV